jgi:hypothetical protein
VFSPGWFLAPALMPLRILDRFLRRPTQRAADPWRWFFPIPKAADVLIPSQFAKADQLAPTENEMVCVSCGQHQPL